LIIPTWTNLRFFILKVDSVTRGHAYTLQPSRCRVDARRYFFLRGLSVPGTASQQAVNISVVWVILNPF